MTAVHAHQEEAEPCPAPGDVLRLRVGPRADAIRAAVISWSDTVGVVRPQDGGVPAGEDVFMRWLDAEGDAWHAQAVSGAADATGDALALRLMSGWQRVAARRAVRIPTPRRRVRCELEARCLDLVGIDVSLTGCRASGIGEPPGMGDLVQIAAESGTYETPRWINARVVRVALHPFRRYEVGFLFEPESDDEHAAVADWRDMALRER